MSRSDEPVPVDHDGYVTETDLAVCYDIGGEKCWFPRSVHDEDDDSKKNVIWVEEWFAEKEGYV